MGRKGPKIAATAFAAALGSVSAATVARADVVISSRATQNMSCSGGVCSPTAADAVLNVTNLQSMLASGNLEVTTTGSGKIQANNIDVNSALTWSETSTLSLLSYNAITVNRTITVAGPGGLSLATPNDVVLSFPGKGRVQFQNLSSPLTIDGTAYTLVRDIKSLASAIAKNPSGAFALADNYDASADGTYTASPIQTTFTGEMDGLGNTISHLSIAPPGAAFVGLFVAERGIAENLRMTGATLIVTNGSIAGILSAEGYYGDLIHDFVSGTISGTGIGSDIGGLSGGGSTIVDCYANVEITDSPRHGLQAGGLVSGNGGSIDQSFAEGSIRESGDDSSYLGGLAGVNDSVIDDSYSTVAVAGGRHAKIGGFVGENGDTNGQGALIYTSYSTGAVSGGRHSRVGGYAGTVFTPAHRYNHHVYWDMDTSGTSQGTGRGNKAGITGLTSSELQSRLPDGFDPSIWAQDPKINNGFPYLIANPPPK